MGALSSRGGKLALAAAAVLVLVIGLAAAGAFDGCRSTGVKGGRPSAAVSGSPYGGVAYATAKVLAQSVGARPADSWGEIHAREFITNAFQQYGYFPLLQEFISPSGGHRVHSGNIIAVKEGDSARRLIVVAHYDSAPVGEGYTDNATGIGLLLEVAARIKKVPTPYTVVFVALGAEQDGRLGSSYYLDTLSKLDRRATIGMIDLDAPAGGDDLVAMSRVGGAAWLRDDALSAAGELGVKLFTGPAGPGRPEGTAPSGSLAVPAAGTGIPTAVLSAVAWRASKGGDLVQTSPAPSMWNTARDTVGYVDKKYPGRVRDQLRDMSRLLETLLTSKLGRHT